MTAHWLTVVACEKFKTRERKTKTNDEKKEKGGNVGLSQINVLEKTREEI